MRTPIVVLSLFLVACTAPVIKVPIGQAALVYADAQTAYVVLSMQVRQACAAGTFKPDVCAEAKTQDAVVRVLNDDVRKGILEAKGEIDWDKVMQMLQALSGLALKAGGL